MCLFPGWNSPTFQYLLPFLLIPSLSSSPLHSQCLMLVAHLEVCDICLRSILDVYDVVDDVWISIFFHMWNQSQNPRSVICKMLKLLCNITLFPMYLVLDIEVDLYHICISIHMLLLMFFRINYVLKVEHKFYSVPWGIFSNFHSKFHCLLLNSINVITLFQNYWFVGEI